MADFLMRLAQYSLNPGMNITPAFSSSESYIGTTADQLAEPVDMTFDQATAAVESGPAPAVMQTTEIEQASADTVQTRHHTQSRSPLVLNQETSFFVTNNNKASNTAASKNLAEPAAAIKIFSTPTFDAEKSQDYPTVAPNHIAPSSGQAVKTDNQLPALPISKLNTTAATAVIQPTIQPQIQNKNNSVNIIEDLTPVQEVIRIQPADQNKLLQVQKNQSSVSITKDSSTIQNALPVQPIDKIKTSQAQTKQNPVNATEDLNDTQNATRTQPADRNKSLQAHTKQNSADVSENLNVIQNATSVRSAERNKIAQIQTKQNPVSITEDLNVIQNAARVQPVEQPESSQKQKNQIRSTPNKHTALTIQQAAAADLNQAIMPYASKTTKVSAPSVQNKKETQSKAQDQSISAATSEARINSASEKNTLIAAPQPRSADTKQTRDHINNNKVSSNSVLNSLEVFARTINQSRNIDQQKQLRTHSQKDSSATITPAIKQREYAAARNPQLVKGQQAAPKNQPTNVTISIGRLEIRAPKPAASTPVARRNVKPVSPVLSLKEYLGRYK